MNDSPGIPKTDPSGLVLRGSLCTLRHRHDVQVEPGLRTCHSHLVGMSDQLADIAFLFAQLDELAVPGPSTENHTRGKPAGSKPPLRLDVLVARDTTLQVEADGLYPVGLVTRWAMRLGRERHLQCLPEHDVRALITRLRLHLRWAADSLWVEEFAKDLRNVGATLRRIAGDIPRPRIGTCFVLIDGEDGQVECGGALLADRQGLLGVGCVKCGDRWTEGELRRLGSIIAEASS